MIAAVLLSVLAGVTFVEQEVVGLEFSRPDPVGGMVRTNFRHADLDGDGYPDLVFPTHVVLQPGGNLAWHTPVILPDPDRACEIDVFARVLYCRFPGGLRAYELKDRQWRPVIDQAIDWSPNTADSSDATDAPTQATLARYLHDLDGDSVPEIVHADLDGLQIFKRIGDRYRYASRLNVFPAGNTRVTQPAAIWPAANRSLRLPEIRRQFEVFWDKDRLRVVAPDSESGARVRYRISRYVIEVKGTGTYVARRLSESTTEPMNRSLRACFLNADDLIDFAGGAPLALATLGMSGPGYETFATTDLGARVQAQRSKSFSPRTLFVDINGDGRADLITETTHLFDGGVRETIARLMTQQSIRHSISVHYQDAHGVFSPTPDLNHTHTLKFGESLAGGGSMVDRYRGGSLLFVTGDFNGDGMVDLLARDKPTRLSLHLFEGGSWADRPSHRIAIEARAEAHVLDVDGDNRADIALVIPNEEEQAPTVRLYLNRTPDPVR